MGSSTMEAEKKLPEFILEQHMVNCHETTGYAVANKPGLLFGKSGPLRQELCVFTGN